MDYYNNYRFISRFSPSLPYWHSYESTLSPLMYFFDTK